MRQFTDAFSACPTLLDLYMEGRTVGRTGKTFESLPAASTRRNLLAIRNLMYSHQAAASLEVGMAFGGSTLAFASTLAALGKPAQGQHVTIDPFQHTVWDDTGLMQVERAGLSGFVKHIAQSSAIALPHLLEQGRSFDVIYIDGSHLFEDVFCDVYFARQLLAVGGVLMLDDASDPHVAKVLRFIRTSWSHCLKEVAASQYLGSDEGRYRELLRKVLSRRQLAVFQLIRQEDRPWNAPFKKF